MINSEEKKDLIDVPLRVSVIVPVYNDEIRLQKCLDALENQSYPKDYYEIIVVDNASTVDLKSIVDCFKQSHYYYEAQPGSYAARNTGLTVSTGEVIAFTDSDCIPAHNWIERGVYALQKNHNSGLVGGAITFFYKNPNCLTGVELYEQYEGFPQKRYIEKENFGATANVFTYRKVIDSVGKFDSKLKSGGDSEWGKRVARAGYNLCYAEDVEVKHPARSTYSEYYKKISRVIGGLQGFNNPNSPNPNITFTQIAYQIVRGVLLPPFSRMRKILNKAKQNTFVAKYKLILVILFIHYAWIFERARCQLKQRNQRNFQAR